MRVAVIRNDDDLTAEPVLLCVVVFGIFQST